MRLPKLSPAVDRRAAVMTMTMAAPLAGAIRPQVCLPVHCTTAADCTQACPICYNKTCCACSQIPCLTASDCPVGCSQCTNNHYCTS
jgi:hypothetical protein